MREVQRSVAESHLMHSFGDVHIFFWFWEQAVECLSLLCLVGFLCCQSWGLWPHCVSCCFVAPWSRLPRPPLTQMAGGQGLPTGRWKRELKGSLWRDWRFHPSAIRKDWRTCPTIFSTREGFQGDSPWGTGTTWGPAGPCRRDTRAPRSWATPSGIPCTGDAPSRDNPAWGLPVMLSWMVPTPAPLSPCTSSLAAAEAWPTFWRRKTCWPRRAPWDRWGPRSRPAWPRTGNLWGPASTKPPSGTHRAGGKFPSLLPSPVSLQKRMGRGCQWQLLWPQLEGMVSCRANKWPSMDPSSGKHSAGPALALGCHSWQGRVCLERESKLIACGSAASTKYEIPVQRMQKVDWFLKINFQCNGGKGEKNVCVQCRVYTSCPFCQEIILSGDMK